MKRITLLCLLLLVVPVVAQDDTPDPLTPEQLEQREQQREALRQSMKKNIAVQKKMLPHLIPRMPRITAGEKSLSFVFLNENFANEEFLAYTGLTKEKALELKQKTMSVFEKGFSGIEKIQAEIETTDDPEELGKLADRHIEALAGIMASQDDILREELTPQQLGKFKDLRLILAAPNKGVAFLFDFGQYEALDLSEEQRRQIDAIRESYEKEFVPLMENVLAVGMKKMERIAETGEFGQPPTAEEKKAEAEAQIPLVQLHARTRAKILALLSKEQTGRLETVLAGAPAYLVKRLGLGEKRDDSWKESWKPGDPIPEGFLKETQKPGGGFPRVL